jgi:hypothetical protein
MEEIALVEHDVEGRRILKRVLNKYNVRNGSGHIGRRIETCGELL